MDEPNTTPQQASAPQLEVPSEVAQFLKRLAEEVKRQGRFTEIYANNFRFEPSLWDFKIVLGELDQEKGQSFVNWHTALTIPWFQVKLLAYYLRLNLAWYEYQNGPLTIPLIALPSNPISAEIPDVKWKEISAEIFKQTFGEDALSYPDFSKPSK